MTITAATLALLNNPWIIGFLIVITLALFVVFCIDMFKTFCKVTGRWKIGSKAERNFKYRFLIIIISGIFTGLNLQYGLPITYNYFMDTIVVSLTSLLTYAIGYKKISRLLKERILRLIKGKGIK